MARLRAGIGVALLVSALFVGPSGAGDAPSPGSQYKNTKPIYIYAQYDSLNDRRITKETARAYLHAERYADKSTVAFQSEVPAGTRITIVGPAPTPWYMRLFKEAYLVQLSPDISRGLEVVLAVDRGLEGDLDGLNAAIFQRVK